MNTIEKFNSHVIESYSRLNLVIDQGSSCSCIDEDGKKYIDFGSGIGTNSLGYCDDDWVDAICSQAKKIQHTSNYYYTKIQADFSAKLCEMTGYEKMFFGNSGAEANEAAIKIARKYSFDKYGKGRHNIVTLKNSFHGRTLCTLSATGQDSFHNYFFPFLDGFINVTANDIDDLRNQIDDTVCAVMFEFIQGEGGVIPLDKAFVDEIFKICQEKDILTIADEVQTGVGRTGKFLASEHYLIKPDITTLAKGLAGGVPIGACLANEKCSNVLTKGTHGSTFGGNPICCAGGLAVLKKLSFPGFLDEVFEKGNYIQENLLKMEGITAVDGIGMMLGATLTAKKAPEVLQNALDKGLLILTAKEKIRLLPPLTISYEEIDLGLKILENIL